MGVIIFLCMNLMTAFHFFSFVDQVTACSDQISEAFKELQDDLFTGIVEIFEDDDRFIAILAQGRIATFYHLREIVERLDGEQWLKHVESTDTTLRIRALNLPVADLRYLKIVVESFGRGANADTHSIDPRTILGKLGTTFCSSITYGESPELTFLNYRSGKDPDRDRSVIISPERIRNVSVEELLADLPEELSQTSVMSVDPKDPGMAWLEQQYQEVFARALKEFMRVYGSARERVYLNKIIRAINFKADANDLLILVNARDVNDQEIFDAPIKAKKNFAALLGVVAVPLRAELGDQVYREVLNTIQLTCTDLQRELLDRLLADEEP